MSMVAKQSSQVYSKNLRKKDLEWQIEDNLQNVLF